MRETVRLGRFADIPIGANWTVLLVFALITLGLAGGLLTDYPGYAPQTYWLAGAIGALVFYAGLLAHELGHAVVARRQGLPVEGITLWLLGGVTRMRGDASSPGGALRVALVGPLVSLAAAGLFGVLALVLDLVAAPELGAGTALWLARINLLLAAFNLIPAAPLDGGRVLEALLWRRRGDRLAASATAAGAGRAVGYGLMGLGLLDVFAGVGFGGLWSVLLGWFVVSAASAEHASRETRARLKGVGVADVMARDAVVVPSWITLHAFTEDYLKTRRGSAFPVTNFDGQLVGLVTLDSLKRVPPPERTSVTVGQVATALEHVPVARPEDMVLDLAERMDASPSRCALVMDHGQVVGTVSSADIDRALELAV